MRSYHLVGQFFSSNNLFEALTESRLRTTAILRINRFVNPPLMSEKAMKKKRRGTSVVVSSKDIKIGIIKWYDNKSFHFGSNFLSLGLLTVTERWNKKKKPTKKLKSLKLCRFTMQIWKELIFLINILAITGLS